MGDLDSCLKDARTEGFSWSTLGRQLKTVLWERVIPCAYSQTCNTTDAGNLLSNSSHQ